MSGPRLRRAMVLLFTLFFLAVIAYRSGQAAQGLEATDRVPRGTPVGPLDLARHRPSQDQPAESPLALAPDDLGSMSNWTRVVFQSARNERDYNLFFGWPYSSSGLRRLTSNSAHDVYPRLNRGATQVVFSSGRTGNWEIFRIDTSGQNLKQLTFHGAVDTRPDWSPDGRQIVFESNRSGQADIYVMNADGSQVRRLTTHPAFDGEPAWSPDGTKIAFSSGRSGDYAIWVMNADGSGQRQLSTEHNSGAPVWSPDSQTIAYYADSDRNGWYDVHTMQRTGAQRKKIFTTSSPYDAFVSSWSPDGRRVVFTRVRWVQYQGNWYWDWASPCHVPASGGHFSCLNYSWDMAWQLDWQTTDTEPPRSHVYPLPAYSREDVVVAWTAEDVGGAGLAKILAQYRPGESSDWITLSETDDYPYGWYYVFEKESGQTVYFRTQAVDQAGNIETPPGPMGDTHTTFYDWFLQGRVVDNRGQPLEDATVVAGPQAFEVHTSGDEGRYRAYFAGTDHTFSTSWAKVGYGSPPTTAFRSDADRQFDVYLPPSDNVVSDSGFEAQALDGDPWHAVGLITPTVGSDYLHTGEAGLLIGAPLDQPEPTALREGIGRHGDLGTKLDGTGTIHLLWLESVDGWNEELHYAYREEGASWSGFVTLNDEPMNVQDVKWDVAPDGKVLVTWNQYDDSRNTIRYIWRDNSGTWSDAQILPGEGRVPLVDLEVDSSSAFDEYPQALVDGSRTVTTVWHGSASVTGYDLNHTSFRVAESDEYSTVSQAVTIPLTMTNPTLSFVTSVYGGQPGSEAALSAQIQAGGHLTTVITVTEAGPWTHQWADVSAWAGQTVTLSLRVQQQAGVPLLSAMVDEVTLGSAPPDLWVELNTPTNAPSGETFPITLRYGNQSASPAGGVQISLTLPAGISFVAADVTPDESGSTLSWDIGDVAAGPTEHAIVMTATMDTAYDPLLEPLLLQAEINGTAPEIELANNVHSRPIAIGYRMALPIIGR
ncbi:MAG: hypothetical protein R3300_12555 [Candidatus Promineifilaceae bacterium]|nr:hypothetical protein [Candidatus Promineifilaceae bacterium]